MSVKENKNSEFSIHNSEFIVPEVRFKGFNGDWEEYPLSTFISSLDAGVSVNSGDRPANESEFGILKTSCVTNGFFEPNENKVVFKAEEINRLKEPVLENTIIISRMNTPALVGANAYISQGFANYFLPDRLWAAKPTAIGDLKFIAYILGSYKGRLALSDLATGTSGSMKNISKPSVLRLTFRVPRDQEQTQIGNYFQKLDNLINQHQQKHDKLSSIKKAMLEKMFPKQGETVPEIRFKGFSEEWRETDLAGACSNFQSGKFIKAEDIKENGAYPVYGGNGLRGFCSAYNHEGIYALIGRQGALCGNMNISHGKAFFTEHAIAVQANKDCDTLFLFYKLGTMNLGQYSGQSAQPGLSVTNLIKLIIFVPEYREQTKIGNYFQKLDTLINQHQQQITKLNNIKQACLSKMFV